VSEKYCERCADSTVLDQARFQETTFNGTAAFSGATREEGRRPKDGDRHSY
jgi:hypothetical protein